MAGDPDGTDDLDARRSRTRPGLGLARRRPGAARLLGRRRPVHRRTAPRHRRRRRARRSRARAGVGSRQFRGPRPGARSRRLDQGGRIPGLGGSARRDARPRGPGGRRGRHGRDGRDERRRRHARAARAPGRPRRRERALRRSALAPAAAAAAGCSGRRAAAHGAGDVGDAAGCPAACDHRGGRCARRTVRGDDCAGSPAGVGRDRGAGAGARSGGARGPCGARSSGRLLAGAARVDAERAVERALGGNAGRRFRRGDGAAPRDTSPG